MKKRQKHNLSHYKLLSCDGGTLIPISHYPVLPGDTIQHSTSILLRASPLLAPVMHRFHVRVHSFFVPYRLLWSGWEDFITGVSTTPPPTKNLVNCPEGGLDDHLGIRPGSYSGDLASRGVIRFPYTAYNLIWNEFFRDQDLQSEVSLTSDQLKRINWGKDYFTTARPWPQKGTAVSLPLGSTAPITGTATLNDGTSDVVNSVGGAIQISGGQVQQGGSPYTGTLDAELKDDSVDISGLSADLSGATSSDVRDIRVAFALQRYQEARAMYGSRYTEYLRYLGITPKDSRLQRPEYLGGGKRDIAFSEVLQTAEGSNPVGTMRGHGISGMSTRPWRRFFEEHGLVMTVMSVRPQSIYQEGIHREWMKTTKEEFFQEELQHVGQQEVYNGEVFYHPTDGANKDVFGYSDRYAEYSSHPSMVAGEFRNALDFWHSARQFSSRPALNSTFVECNPPTRIFAVPSNDTFWIAAQHKVGARRLVKKNAQARVI